MISQTLSTQHMSKLMSNTIQMVSGTYHMTTQTLGIEWEPSQIQKTKRNENHYFSISRNTKQGPPEAPLQPQVGKSFLPPDENQITKVLVGVRHHPCASPASLGHGSLKSYSHRCKLIASAVRLVLLAHNISWVDNVCWREPQGATPPGVVP